MLKTLLLKLLYMFSGKVDALTEQFSYKNRHTRRSVARELVGLGY